MAWFGRGVHKSLNIGLLGLLFLWGSAWGQAVIIAIPPSNLITFPGTPGEKSEGFLFFGCYDIHTRDFLDCHVTVELDRLDPEAMDPPFFGGHRVHSPKPLGTVRDANGPGPGGKKVEGDTLKGFSVVYTAPDASGQEQVTIRSVPPPNYTCVSEPDPDVARACKRVRRINAGIELPELPPDPFYGVIREDGTRHPSGTSGADGTLKQLKGLAAFYNAMTGTALRLSINDISLPQGGFFDHREDWSIGHKFHRIGTDVDINRAPLDQNGNPLEPIDCLQDLTLREAVEWLATDTGLPAILCESGGRKHISF